MEFQILGKVEKVLPVQTFNKKDGTQGCRYGFVLLVNENDFSYKAMFTTLGEDKWKNLAIVEGATYSISFNISSREWNGKWFTEAKAYKAVRLDNPNAQPQQQATKQPHTPPQPQPTPPSPTNNNGQQGDGSGDLPF